MKRLLFYTFLVTVYFTSARAYAANTVVVIPLNSKKPSNVITVAKSGGDFNDPVTAMNSITDAASNNLYLVAIGPGVYTLTSSLVMKEYVSVVGAGVAATKITGAISSDSTARIPSSLVIAPMNSLLSELTIENTGGHSRAYGILIESGYNQPSTILHNLNVSVTGGTFETTAIYSNWGGPIISNVTASASGIDTKYISGIRNVNSNVMIDHSDVTVSGGVTSYGIYSEGGSSSVVVNDVTITSDSSVDSYGIYNYYTISNMTNISVNVSAVNFSYGVYNNQLHWKSNPMKNISASVTNPGLGSSYGIYNYYSRPEIFRSTMEGNTNGIYSYHTGGGSFKIIQSSIIGGSASAGGITHNCILSDNGASGTLTSACSVAP